MLLENRSRNTRESAAQAFSLTSENSCGYGAPAGSLIRMRWPALAFERTGWRVVQMQVADASTSLPITPARRKSRLAWRAGRRLYVSWSGALITLNVFGGFWVPDLARCVAKLCGVEGFDA